MVKVAVAQVAGTAVVGVAGKAVAAVAGKGVAALVVAAWVAEPVPLVLVLLLS